MRHYEAKGLTERIYDLAESAVRVTVAVGAALLPGCHEKPSQLEKKTVPVPTETAPLEENATTMPIKTADENRVYEPKHGSTLQRN